MAGCVLTEELPINKFILLRGMEAGMNFRPITQDRKRPKISSLNLPQGKLHITWDTFLKTSVVEKFSSYDSYTYAKLAVVKLWIIQTETNMTAENASTYIARSKHLIQVHTPWRMTNNLYTLCLSSFNRNRHKKTN